MRHGCLHKICIDAFENLVKQVGATVNVTDCVNADTVRDPGMPRVPRRRENGKEIIGETDIGPTVEIRARSMVNSDLSDTHSI